MSRERELTIGSIAPDFNLEGDEGISRSLQNYKGSKVVLYFYPRDNTPGCTREACSFRDQYGEIKRMGAEILGISMDDTKSHKKFKERHNLPFPLLSDPGGKVSKIYGVYKMKNLYGRSFMGIERSTFIIDEEGKIRSIFRKVRVDGHTKEVIDAIA